MDLNYFTSYGLNLGFPIWLTVILLVWSLAWKLVALWKSARHKSIVWFIVLGIVNTLGILEILYIFVFSKLGMKTKNNEKPVSKKSHKSSKSKKRR
ncbi:MAG: DUF5652 family protein [Candidatus Pacearchaeota archaeon]|jgi:hypothetical protein